MDRVVRACRSAKTRVGAHPSYEDREGFGRRSMTTPPETLRSQIEAQLLRLRSVAEKAGAPIVSVKLHGALYHDAHAQAAIAEVAVRAVKQTLGTATIVGPPDGALAHAAAAEGLPYWREAFADRGTRADGTLLPRSEPGALVTEAPVAAERARVLAARNDVDTICIHADTPSALAIARAVRAALGPKC
jgi:UPF0271 protein